MRIQSRTITAASGLVLAALLLAGCGGSSDLPLRTIAFDAPSGGPLAARTADMRRAAQLELDAIDGHTNGSRLQLSNGANRNSIAMIDALARFPDGGPNQLLVTLVPPPRREVAAPAHSMLQTGPEIKLLPANDIARSALNEYRGSGATGATGAVADSPMTPGTPKGQYVTAGMSSHSYPPAGSDFFDKFVKKYGHAPDRYAIYAYEAVGLIVDAIDRVEKTGKPVTQQSVAEAAQAITGRYGPVGHYDVLPSGQTTLYVFQARGAGAPTGQASLIEALR